MTTWPTDSKRGRVLHFHVWLSWGKKNHFNKYFDDSSARLYHQIPLGSTQNPNIQPQVWSFPSTTTSYVMKSSTSARPAINQSVPLYDLYDSVSYREWPAGVANACSNVSIFAPLLAGQGQWGFFFCWLLLNYNFPPFYLSGFECKATRPTHNLCI